MTPSAAIHTPGSLAQLLTNEKLPLINRSLHLSIEVREEQLLICLLDKHTNKYIAWALYPLKGKDATLEKALEQDILNCVCSTTSVVFTPNSFILVPALYFKKEAVGEYLKQQQLDKADEIPCHDYIKNLDSYNLYTVNNKTLAVIRQKFPGASLRHHSSILLEYLLIENKNTQEDKVYISVFNSYMDIVVLQAGKLILSNRFYYKTSGDFIYYLLWIYEQLQLNVEKAFCTFYGEVEKSSDIFLLSAKYIKKITFGENEEQFSRAIPLSALSAHKYHSLFTQYLCI